MRMLLLIVLLYFPSVSAADTESDAAFSDDSVSAAARRSLVLFLDKIPPGRESRYGFFDRYEFTRAIIGVPMRVYTADPDSADEVSGNGPDSPKVTNEWRVPVLVDGESRALLTVSVTDGALTATELGAAGLSRELGEFKKKYPARRSALLRLHTLQCDFIINDRTGSGFDKGDYHPLRSARDLFRSNDSSPRLREELFTEIRRLHRQRSATHSQQE